MLVLKKPKTHKNELPADQRAIFEKKKFLQALIHRHTQKKKH